jgi:hypothetical protein
MKIRVSCRDKYEAKKLASLIYVKDSDETFITEILNVVENEVVVSLKDKSAHSVILKDGQAVELFADFFQSVFEKKHRIVRIDVFEEEVEIIKE